MLPLPSARTIKDVLWCCVLIQLNFRVRQAFEKARLGGFPRLSWDWQARPDCRHLVLCHRLHQSRDMIAHGAKQSMVRLWSLVIKQAA